MKAADIDLLSLRRLKCCGGVGVGALLTMGGAASLSAPVSILCSAMVEGLLLSGMSNLLFAEVLITVVSVAAFAVLCANLLVSLLTGEDANTSVDFCCTGTPLAFSIDGNPWTAPRALSTAGGDVDRFDRFAGGSEESCAWLYICSSHTCEGFLMDFPRSIGAL